MSFANTKQQTVTDAQACQQIPVLLKARRPTALPLIAESIFLNSTKIRTASSSATPSGICKEMLV
jgi:hypothetical protein